MCISVSTMCVGVGSMGVTVGLGECVYMMIVHTWSKG